jgi:septum site-determining protein MinC
MDRPIQIKGTREGLTITLGSSDMASVLRDLGRQLRVQGAFFRGGTVALQATSRALSPDDVMAIRDLLAEHEMTLRTIVTGDELTMRTARQLGLKLVESEQLQAPVSGPARETDRGEAPASAGDGNRGILVRRVVRSGQTVRHTGHVVVVGDVNVGAELIAGGDVVVWGRLRGLAHAGCRGDSQAIVCALEFTPQQVLISNYVRRPDDERTSPPSGPVVARVVDGAIVIESWDQARRKA